MNLPNNTLLQGGKYRIIRFIANGGFGCTYEAELVLLHKRIAIKEFFVKDFCNRNESNSHVTVATQSKVKLVERLKKKFIEEASTLFSMQHPNIVRVTDVFEENDTAYYVMDYIDGESLQDIVKKKGKLDESLAINYIKQVADALKYVHSLNRLHLDIKPSNIMIDKNNQAILIDFGASKQYDEIDGENTSTLMGKTPGYAPLEQIGNEVAKFLPATDIYALGATLYKLVTGITPVSATQLASGESLAPIPDTASLSTQNAIYAAMEINKNKRPQSINAFLSLFDINKTEAVTMEDQKDEEIPMNVEHSEETTLEYKEEDQTKDKDWSYLQPAQKASHTDQTTDSQAKSSLKKIWFGIGLIGILLALICFIITAHQTPEQIYTEAREHYEEKNYKKAFDLYLEAAANGYVPAQSQLGYMYNMGEGVPQDKTKAIEWYTKAAEQGDAIAQNNLAYMYYIGQGVSQNKTKAFELFTKAAEQGYNKAKEFLNKINTEERIVDLGLSIKWSNSNLGALKGNIYGEGFSFKDIDSNNFVKNNFGENWRLPTKEEFEELLNKCYWEWENNGYKIIGPNGNNIFLHATGYYYNGKLDFRNKTCGYWTSTSCSYGGLYTCSINSDGYYEFNSYKGSEFRYFIRPVYSAQEENTRMKLIKDNNTYKEVNTEIIDELPQFPGGESELKKFLANNIKYPTIAQENGTEGRVEVEFIIDKNGSIVDPVVVNSIDPYLDQEAIRVIKSMPKWKPGKVQNKAVRVKYTIPVIFKLE